jgi:hypothetical protein
MNEIRKRSSHLRVELKKRMARKPFSQEQIAMRRLSQLKAEKTMREMWENYLTFASLEL